MIIKWVPPSFDAPVSEVVNRATINPGLSESQQAAATAAAAAAEKELAAIREQAYEAGFAQGYKSAYAKGEQEGLEAGTKAGAQVGYQQAYDDAKQDIDALHLALHQVLASLQGIPDAISESLNEFAYELALRISGADNLDRAPFVAAIQEALMRLPLPGENVFLRIRGEEVETWNRFVGESGLPFTCTLLIDSDVPAGHAYVEIAGARIDVGYEARKALVRSALGLSAPNDIS
jgi:flagellar assembly protein FliH